MVWHSRVVVRAVLIGLLTVPCGAVVAGCGAPGGLDTSGAPPPAVVERASDSSAIRVERPERFPLVAATTRQASAELKVTGVVTPDVSRAIPVVSLSSGRVVDLRVKLGDDVQEGQLLLRIRSADVSAAFSDYRKAVADEVLAESQLERAKALLAHGGIAAKDEELAQDAADKARVDVEAASERLRILGVDPHSAPTDIINVLAPASGVVTEQNVTNAAGVKSLDNSSNLLTISDLSRVWILCDVYERDLQRVGVGDLAEIQVAAYPGRPVRGHVGNIGSILDFATRTAKARVEVANPGLLRIGMFVTATIQSRAIETRVVVPASAVLHLRDRDWVYVDLGDGRFDRREVVGGQMLSGDRQELRSGLRPGERVVANALVFQNTAEQ